MNICRNSRYIMPRIGLSSNKQRSFVIFWVFFKEFQCKIVEIDCNLVFRSVVIPLGRARNVWKACANWLVYVDYVWMLIPAIGILPQTQIIINLPGPILKEHRQLRGTSRSTRQPEHKGVVVFVSPAPHEPVEEIVAIISHLDEAWGLVLPKENVCAGENYQRQEKENCLHLEFIDLGYYI